MGVEWAHVDMLACGAAKHQQDSSTNRFHRNSKDFACIVRKDVTLET